MRYEVEAAGRTRIVAVEHRGGGFLVSVDGRVWRVDASRAGASLSLLVSPQGPGEDSLDVPVASHDVAVAPAAAGQLIVHVDGAPVPVRVNGRRRRGGALDAGGAQHVTAPMPGKVIRVLVRAGDTVAARQPLVVVEAMKMENELRAGRPGTVAAVHVVEGASVEAGALLLEIRS